MSKKPVVAIALVTLFLPSAYAEPPAVLRDLESMSPVTLSKQDLEALLPDTKVVRVIANGNTHIWKNGTDGTFIISSDNRATTNKSATAPGKWHISDDGRYCVLIEWRNGTSEDWCRYVMKTADGYYLSRSTKSATEKVYRFEFSN